MSEAEEKWENWDLHFLFIQYTKGTEPGYKYFEKSREAYKAALRREIEKRIAYLKEMRDSPDTATGSDDWFQYATLISEAKTILKLLDTVEP